MRQSMKNITLAHAVHDESQSINFKTSKFSAVLELSQRTVAQLEG